jgi:hypothetical protein
MNIDAIIKLTHGKWVVKYTTRVGCCGLLTKSIIIEQLEKPTQEDAIRNIRKSG